MNHAEFRHILTLELSAQKQHNSEYFGSNGKNGLFRAKGGGAQASPEELLAGTKPCHLVLFGTIWRY